MGCWLSSSKQQMQKNATFDGTYVAVSPPTRGLSRRLWRNRNSYASSSGVSSGCTTPASSKTPVKVLSSLKNDLTYENWPIKNIFAESDGYYTDESSDCSTPSSQDLKYTQSGSEQLNESISSVGNLEMEIQVMGTAIGIMPKTSSPIMQRREIALSSEPLPSASYQKWQEYLQTAPNQALQNITNIPEAVAGRFCPADFPAYTDVRVCEKHLITCRRRHPSNINYPGTQVEENIAETIIMELPVPTISTEL